MESLKVLSPAKLNLMLRVLAQRADGYHELQSCFQLLNWGDEMQFDVINLKGQGLVSIKGEFPMLALTDNLIYKAAQMLKPLAKNQANVHITVQKNIPQGSGLGGGSSNAATALITLNRIWNCGCSMEQLKEIGLKLGADVPIFIHGKSAIATGVGEKLKSCDFGTHHYLLFFPSCSVNTASVFSDIELKRDQLMVSDTDALNPKNWINDCLAVVLKHHPEVRDLYQLISKTVQVRMSGTGSTLFAIFKDKKAALKYQSEFCRKIKTLYVVPHGHPESPYIGLK